jgi:cell filamentation protein
MSTNWLTQTLYSNGVLKNKKGIRNEKRLMALEYRISAKVALALLEKQVKVKNISDLHKIHKLMFQSLYDWAGQERSGDFSKGSTFFLPHDRFAFARKDINQLLAQKSDTSPLTKHDYAILLDKLNYYHPFREGNGRSAKTFIQLFALEHHQVIDYPRYDSGMIEALSEANIEKISSYIDIHDSTALKIVKEQAVHKFKKQYQQYLKAHNPKN